MGTCYYAQFRLHADQPGIVDEYSGVVELTGGGSEQVLEPRQIELLLARTFQRGEEDVELLSWSRVH